MRARRRGNLLPGVNNGAPKIMEVSRIGKTAKRQGKERNDFEQPGMSLANIGTEYKEGDRMNRRLRYCPKCNTLPPGKDSWQLVLPDAHSKRK
jgi:hypothetical protein